MGESGSLGNGGPGPLPPPVLLIPNSSLRLHFKAWLVTEPPAAAGAEMILGCGRAQVGCKVCTAGAGLLCQGTQGFLAFLCSHSVL